MARFSRQGSFVRGAVTGVAVSALLVAGLVAPPSAANTQTPNVGVTNVYPTVFPAAPGTNVTVTVVNPSGTPSYLTPDTTAQFTNCTPGVKDGNPSAFGALAPTAPSASNGNQEANSIAVFSVPKPVLGTALPVVCNLTLTNAIGSGLIGQGTAKNTAFTFMANAPSLTSISPSSFAATPPSTPLVTIQGSNLTGIFFNNSSSATAAPMSLPAAASVFMTNCTVNTGAYGTPVVNPVGISVPPNAKKTDGKYQDYAHLNGNTISTLLNNGVMASTCDVVVPIPAISGNLDGYDYLSLNQAFTWQPPTQAPIQIKVTNPYHASGKPRSGITDANLYLSILGTPGPAATPSQGCTTGGGAWAGPWPTTAAKVLPVSAAGLNSVAFTNLSDYSSTNHTGTLTICPSIASGNLYVSHGSLTGTAPSPQKSTQRYGLVEFTYNNNGLDADLTLIDQIGMAMSMSMSDDRTQIQGSYRDTGCLVDIVNDLSKQSVDMSNWSTTSILGGVSLYSSAPPSIPAAGAWTAANLQDNPSWVRILGPSQNPAAYPSTKTYATSITSQLTIKDHLGDATFNGPFDYTATLSDGTWTLTGTVTYPKGVSVVNGPTLQV
ncbi:MAG: beta-1,3-glucanase family protein [Actinomycetota bacterium]